jgi:hypothetical protein
MRAPRIAIFVLLTAGCASQSAQQPSVNLAGYPPEFKQGYADGCASAPALAARKRDEPRFKSDANYAQGWRDGYDICRKK